MIGKYLMQFKGPTKASPKELTAKLKSESALSQEQGAGPRPKREKQGAGVRMRSV